MGGGVLFLVVVSCLTRLLLPRLVIADAKSYWLAVGWLLLVFAAFLVWLLWWPHPVWQRWPLAAASLLVGVTPYVAYIFRHERG